MGVAAQVAAIRAALGPRPVAIFPEGTTGDGRTLAPFKPALLAALDPPPPGLQVQAVRIDYGAATGELVWVGDEPGVSHARRVLGRRGHFVATLDYTDPFAAHGDRKAIAAEARRRIVAAGAPAI
jgi:1-acyl-sn-glycerol-3-phosphate acyltransferase